MEDQEIMISQAIDKKKYFLFVAVNFIAVNIILFASGLIKINYLLVGLTSLLIVLAQYPLLYKYKNRFIRILIFYFSFIAFCFCLNIILAIKMGNQITGFESIKGLLARGVFFALAGHIYSFIYFPIILGINWAIRKKVFQ